MFNCREGMYSMNEIEPFYFISGLWTPILTSYWIACSTILESCDLETEYHADILIKKCQENALQLLLEGNKKVSLSAIVV